MALAPETVKTIVTNSVTGTAGIVGTTVPSVQLSNARAENAELRSSDNTQKLEKVSEMLKFYADAGYTTFGYHGNAHPAVVRQGGQGVDKHAEELGKVRYCFKKIESSDGSYHDKCKKAFEDLKTKGKETIKKEPSGTTSGGLNLAKYQADKDPFEEITTPTLEP